MSPDPLDAVVSGTEMANSMPPPASLLYIAKALVAPGEKRLVDVKGNMSTWAIRTQGRSQESCPLHDETERVGANGREWKSLCRRKSDRWRVC